ncbi:MAG: portal protein [Candidatus Omnitrophota bacterium]
MTPEEAIRRQKELESERANWASYWQELATFCLPKKATITSPRSSGQQIDLHNIFDDTAIRALKIMAAGFHSHLTNPSSKWFELQMKNKAFMESKAVKIWLKETEDIIFDTLNSSNFDTTMQEFYPDSGCFGTAAIFEEEDTVEKIRFTVLPIGEIYIEEDAQGRVNRLFRKFQYTVLQAFERWGNDAGETVTKAITEKKYSKTIDILHWIIPREKRTMGKEDALNLPWESKWVEITKAHLIRESGYHEFPTAVGRFTKMAGEKWGYSPAMDAMADIRMINAEKKYLIRAAMKIIDPPLVLPSQGFILPLNLNPSGINYRNPQTKSDDLQPIITKANIPIGLEMIQDVRNSIEETFYVPLFKAFSQITKQMTIPEVQRRIAENMVLLGPVVGRFTQEVFDPIIIRTFNILARNNHLPPPPPEIQGQEFDVVYISQLAKAQRNSEILSLERTLETIGAIANIVPSVLDKIDTDKAVDIIAEIHGTNPNLIRDDEEVLAIRQERVAAAEKAQQQAEMAQAATTAKDISQADKNLRPVGGKK